MQLQTILCKEAAIRRLHAGLAASSLCLSSSQMAQKTREPCAVVTWKETAVRIRILERHVFRHKVLHHARMDNISNFKITTKTTKYVPTSVECGSHQILTLHTFTKNTNTYWLVKLKSILCILQLNKGSHKAKICPIAAPGGYGCEAGNNPGPGVSPSQCTLMHHSLIPACPQEIRELQLASAWTVWGSRSTWR